MAGVAFITFDALCVNSSVLAVDEPVAVLPNVYDGGMAVLTRDALDALFTVGDDESGGGVIAISDGVGID